jgi:hypothetical protein
LCELGLPTTASHLRIHLTKAVEEKILELPALVFSRENACIRVVKDASPAGLRVEMVIRAQGCGEDGSSAGSSFVQS